MGFITAMGFLTFGQSCSGLVLNNYASNDSLMSLSRVAVAVALVFSYPLAFQGCRDGIIDILQVPASQRTNNKFLNVTTVILLSIITLLASVLKDVKVVLALGGATLGNLLTYVYPAIMYRAIVQKQNRVDQTFGVCVSSLSAILGVFLGAIGSKMALQK
jgi:Transmembrane amino acid transporter protein